MCLRTGIYHSSIDKADWMYTMGGHGPSQAILRGAILLCPQLMFRGQCVGCISGLAEL